MPPLDLRSLRIGGSSAQRERFSWTLVVDWQIHDTPIDELSLKRSGFANPERASSPTYIKCCQNFTVRRRLTNPRYYSVGFALGLDWQIQATTKA